MQFDRYATSAIERERTIRETLENLPGLSEAQKAMVRNTKMKDMSNELFDSLPLEHDMRGFLKNKLYAFRSAQKSTARWGDASWKPAQSSLAASAGILVSAWQEFSMGRPVCVRRVWLRVWLCVCVSTHASGSWGGVRWVGGLALV